MKKSKFILLVSLMIIFLKGNFLAQEVLFDFDNAPLYTSLPIDLTVGGITAHLSATSPGYSIQNADVLGFTPPGFSGRILYPNSINLSDLFISYDKVLTDFSIIYSPDELGCDNSATMRVTAYMNGIFVGTNTRTATFPGTWPVDTLSCSFPQGFNNVVVHYDSPPPTCQDYGTIFMADNMRVTPLVVNVNSEIADPSKFTLSQNFPNPFNPSTVIEFSLPEDASNVKLSVYNALGEKVAELVNTSLAAGKYSYQWNAQNVTTGIYIYELRMDPSTGSGQVFVSVKKMLLLK